MRIDDLIYQLMCINETFLRKRNIEDIFLGLHGPVIDSKDTLVFLCELNRKTSSNLEKFIMRLGSGEKVSASRLSDAERLLLYVRAMCAIGQLGLLFQSHRDGIDANLLIDARTGHEIPWALISLWETFGKQSLIDAALSISAGDWSLNKR